MTLSSLRAWLILLAANMGLVGWAIGARQWPDAWAPIIAECVGVFLFYLWVEREWPGKREREVTEEAAEMLREVLEELGECVEDDCDCAGNRAGRWLEHHRV